MSVRLRRYRRGPGGPDPIPSSFIFKMPGNAPNDLQFLKIFWGSMPSDPLVDPTLSEILDLRLRPSVRTNKDQKFESLYIHVITERLDFELYRMILN